MTSRSRPSEVRRRVALVAASVLAFLLVAAVPAAAGTVVGPGGGSPPVVDAPRVGDSTIADSDPTQDPSEGLVPAVPEVPDVPSLTVDLTDDEGMSQSVVLLVLFTLGAVVPALLLLTTSFTRFVVVLGLTKNALGLQTVPPSQVLVGLAVFLSLFAMGPTLSEINEEAVQPYMAGEIEQGEAFEAGFAPMRDFMLSQTREEDLELFVDLSGREAPATVEEVSATTLIPAFVISELRAAFVMGFMIFIPFLVVDFVVAAVLMSMGMMMLPPVFISLPLKLLLFVLVDGWVLIAGSLVRSVAM